MINIQPKPEKPRIEFRNGEYVVSAIPEPIATNRPIWMKAIMMAKVLNIEYQRIKNGND